MDSIFHRTSVRTYLDKEVEQEKIEKLMRAAMAAPSAVNQQPWEFYIVKNKEKLQALGSVTPYSTPATKAPMAIVACYRKECRVPLYAQIDMSACVENILLEADALELGAVWLGIAPLEDRMKAVSEILNIPDTLEVFAVIPCGYPEKVRPQQDRYEENRVHYVE